PSLQIPIEPLTHEAFAPFGHVVANPTKHPGTTANYKSSPGNQGSAIKYSEVTDLTNFYTLAPSKKAAKTSFTLFVSTPRKLRTSAPAYTSAYPRAGQQHFYDIKILERHPFTSQTFVPLGRANGDNSTQYLVVVAPTLPPSTKDGLRPPPFPEPEPRPRKSILDIFTRARPSPFTNEAAPPKPSERAKGGLNMPRGSGMPDLRNMRAFIANGDQVLTYGPGTWHAPMVVFGKESMDFIVVQYKNDVGLEDCQEVELDAGVEGSGIAV
ncbi:ureidoglycolate hydrolase, partial [Rhizodiscina lignyota]